MMVQMMVEWLLSAGTESCQDGDHGAARCCEPMSFQALGPLLSYP
jgi:hypothetical protein